MEPNRYIYIKLQKKNTVDELTRLKGYSPFARNRTGGPRMICVTLQSDALIQLSYKGVLVIGYCLWRYLDATRKHLTTQNLKSHIFPVLYGVPMYVPRRYVT
jgi:hypothetical protein